MFDDLGAPLLPLTATWHSHGTYVVLADEDGCPETEKF